MARIPPAHAGGKRTAAPSGAENQAANADGCFRAQPSANPHGRVRAEIPRRIVPASSALVDSPTVAHMALNKMQRRARVFPGGFFLAKICVSPTARSESGSRSSKNAGYMGFAVTEFAAGGMPGTLPPSRAARDSDLLRYFINSVPHKVGLLARPPRRTPNSFLKLWLCRFSLPGSAPVGRRSLRWILLP